MDTYVERKQRLVDAVASLGNDVPAIIATLQKHNIRGRPYRHHSCPVAQYLRETLSSTWHPLVRVSVGCSETRVSYGDSDRLRMRTPIPVLAFITLFDSENIRSTREDIGLLELLPAEKANLPML